MQLIALLLRSHICGREASDPHQVELVRMVEAEVGEVLPWADWQLLQWEGVCGGGPSAENDVAHKIVDVQGSHSVSASDLAWMDGEVRHTHTSCKERG